MVVWARDFLLSLCVLGVLVVKDCDRRFCAGKFEMTLKFSAQSQTA